MVAQKMILVFVFAITNGFFVAAEFSLVAMRKSRIEQLVQAKHPLAAGVLKAAENLDIYLAATQLGITMSSIALGWIGEPVVAESVQHLLNHWLPGAMSVGLSHVVATAIAFTFITVLHIVVGELAPKSLALEWPEKVALFVSKPLAFYLLIFKPAIHSLNFLGNLFLRAFRLPKASANSQVHSVAELVLLVEATTKAGLLDPYEQEILEGAFHLSDQKISALMTPRTAIVYLDVSDSADETRQFLASCPYSVLPVCKNNLDQTIGVVEAKKLLAQLLTDGKIRVEKAMVEAVIVPESMRASKLLEVFTTTKQHLALVMNEHGGIEGLITLNNVLESILGSVVTQDNKPVPMAKKQGDNSWIVEGLLSLEDFCDLFAISDLPTKIGPDVNTIGGLIFKILQKVPVVQERLLWNGFEMRILEMDRNRIRKIRVKRVDQSSNIH